MIVGRIGRWLNKGWKGWEFLLTFIEVDHMVNLHLVVIFPTDLHVCSQSYDFNRRRRLCLGSSWVATEPVSDTLRRAEVESDKHSKHRVLHYSCASAFPELRCQDQENRLLWSYGQVSTLNIYLKQVQVVKWDRSVYTGYLDVDYGAKHMFFYFFESRRSPEKDDVMMWINGGEPLICTSKYLRLYLGLIISNSPGPGCSSSMGLLMELGMYLSTLIIDEN